MVSTGWCHLPYSGRNIRLMEKTFRRQHYFEKWTCKLASAFVWLDATRYYIGPCIILKFSLLLYLAYLRSGEHKKSRICICSIISIVLIAIPTKICSTYFYVNLKVTVLGSNASTAFVELWKGRVVLTHTQKFGSTIKINLKNSFTNQPTSQSVSQSFICDVYSIAGICFCYFSFEVYVCVCITVTVYICVCVSMQFCLHS